MDANSPALDTSDFADEMAKWPVGETYPISVQKTDIGYKVVSITPDAGEPSEPAAPEADLSKHKNPAIAILMTRK